MDGDVWRNAIDGVTSTYRVVGIKYNIYAAELCVCNSTTGYYLGDDGHVARFYSI